MPVADCGGHSGPIAATLGTATSPQRQQETALDGDSPADHRLEALDLGTVERQSTTIVAVDRRDT